MHIVFNMLVTHCYKIFLISFFFTFSSFHIYWFQLFIDIKHKLIIIIIIIIIYDKPLMRKKYYKNK